MGFPGGLTGIMKQEHRLWILLATIVAGRTLAAGAGQPVTVTRTCTVRPNGDLDVACEVLVTDALHDHLTRAVTDATRLLCRTGMLDRSTHTTALDARYDAARRTVKATWRVLGGARNRGAAWYIPLLRGDRHAAAAPSASAIVLTLADKLDDGTPLAGTTRVSFPEGTRDIAYDGGRGWVVFEMPPPQAPGGDRVALPLTLMLRDDLMTCIYKAYANPEFDELWVAKAIFTNTGATTVRDLRVRFRVRGYSDWSEWKRTHAVYPTQTVCEPFFPILSHEVRKLTAATTTALDVEWTYRGPDGAVVEDAETRRITLLGLNEMMYSLRKPEERTTWHEAFELSPIVYPAYVSHTDPIMQRYAGMAARVTRGAGASESDGNARRFMQAVYELMWHHRIQYQSPPWMFRHGLRQHVKFGRDVLRNRAGTCIDLAILVASGCDAGGLNPMIAQVHGHVFPVIKLPSGGLQPVETTDVAGARAGGKIPFGQACRDGEAALRKWRADGRLYLIDVQAMRAKGVPAPELPDLPPSALDDWGITMPPQDLLDTLFPPTQIAQAAGGPPSFSVPGDWRVEAHPGAVTAKHPAEAVSVTARSEAKSYPTSKAFADAAEAELGRLPGWTRTDRYDEARVAGRPAVMLAGHSRPAGGAEVFRILYVAVADHQQHRLELVCPRSEYERWRDTLDEAFKWWKIPEGDAPGPADADRPQTAKAIGGLPCFTVPGGWEIDADRGAVAARHPREAVSVAARSEVKRYQTSKAFADATEAELGRLPGWTRTDRYEEARVAGRPAVMLAGYSRPADGAEPFLVIYLVVTDRQQHRFECRCPRGDYDRWKDTLNEAYKWWRIPEDDAPAPEPTPAPAPAGQPQTAKALEGLPSFTVPGDWKVTAGRGTVAAQHPTEAVSVTARSEARRLPTSKALADAAELECGHLPGWTRTDRDDEARVAGRPAVMLAGYSRQTGGAEPFLVIYLVVTDRQQHRIELRCPRNDYARWKDTLTEAFKWWKIP